MSSPASRTVAAPDFAALDAMTEAIESGAGLPEVVRAAGRVLDASLALVDRTGSVLAVAARSAADERSLLGDAPDVEVLELRVADAVVGTLRLRARGEPGGAQRYVVALIASEVERVRAPERASAEATASFVRAVLSRDGGDPEALVARGMELAIDVGRGGSVLVARAHPIAPAEDGWRRRFVAVAERGARGPSPGAVAVLADRAETGAAEAVLLLPGGGDESARRACDAVVRELGAALLGFSFTVGRSRAAEEVADLPRAAGEARLAANVAEGRPERGVLAFDETGAYRLLLSAMSEDPAELQRFYAETVEPLVAYDEQYETELVKTLEAFLEADGNVAATASRLFTHRHTIRYRFERVRDLSGLDVGSSDGREKLSLGLKAMRVLGIAAPGGPALEAGAGGGRVPRGGGRD